MTSPPETDKEYAYFSAIGEDDPEIISRELELTPDKQWKLGDQYERNNRKFFRKTSFWQMDSGLTDQDTLTEHLAALVKKLETKEQALKKIQGRFKTKLVCVGYYYQSFSFEIDLDLQRRATDLGLIFSFDTYSFGDYHEEIIDLREQVFGQRTDQG